VLYSTTAVVVTIKRYRIRQFLIQEKQIKTYKINSKKSLELKHSIYSLKL